MTLERNELIRLRERVAGLLERNTSLVHAKRDLEARVKQMRFDAEISAAGEHALKDSVNRWKHTADDFKAAYIEGQACIKKLKAQVKKLEAETNGCGVNARDIPIREAPPSGYRWGA
jgi:chromosome segregation ATPase